MITQCRISVTDLSRRILAAYVKQQGASATDQLSLVRAARVAAANLLRWSRLDHRIPIDPELFVRAVTLGKRPGLARLDDAGALVPYRALLRRIVSRLKRELQAELDVINQNAHSWGREITALEYLGPKVSPMSCYIWAHQHARIDLADYFQNACRPQHEACPLYRQAVATFLEPDLYPVTPDSETLPPVLGCVAATPEAHLLN